MVSAIVIFDYAQTICVSVALFLTMPIACFVYFKLLFVKPFSESYTFKLIVMYGMTELVNTFAYLIVYQLTSFSFTNGFYISVQSLGLATPLATLCVFLSGMALHTSFFIAINRTMTMLFFHRRDNELMSFMVSVVLSFLLTLPAVLDFVCFTTSAYKTISFGDETILFPGLITTNEFFRTFSNVIRMVVSLATFVINIFLCGLISRERKFTNMSDKKKFTAEKGLVITSIISYATYMIFFANNLINRYFHVTFCGYAQWMFLGIKSLSPFCNPRMIEVSRRFDCFCSAISIRKKRIDGRCDTITNEI